MKLVKVAPGKSIYDKRYIRQAIKEVGSNVCYHPYENSAPYGTKLAFDVGTMKWAVIPCENADHRNLNKYISHQTDEA